MRKMVQRISTGRVVAAAGFILLACILSFGIALAATNVTSGPTPLPTMISPNGDGFFDTTTISHSLASDAYVNVRIYTSSFATTPLRNLMTNSFQIAGSNSTVWNGKDESGVTVADSLYYPRLDGISFRNNLIGTTFSSPSQIAVDNTRRNPTSGVVGSYPVIYIADTANNRIMWTPDYGNTWDSISSTNNGGLVMTNVHGVGVLTIDSSGKGPDGTSIVGVNSGYTGCYLSNTTNVWFTLEGDARLYGYKWNGTTWSQFHNARRNAADRLRQLSIDSQGSVYVTEVVLGRLMKFFWDDSLLTPAWGRNWSGFNFVNPLGVFAETTGVVYVADASTSAANPSPGRIWKSIDAGNTFQEFAVSGSENGKVSYPRQLFGENGRLWCADTGNNRAQEFWNNGKWIQTLSGVGSYSLSSPRGVTVDSNGYLFVTDTGTNNIKRYMRDNILASSIQVDNTLPVSYQIQSVSSPSGDFYYQRGGITIIANAADDPGGTGVGRVEFYKNDGLSSSFTLMSTAYSSPFSYTWNTSVFDDGSHQLKIKVFDKVENCQESAVYPIVVDNTAPVSTISSPSSGSYVKGNVAISGSSTDTNHSLYSLSYDNGGWQLIQDGISPVSNGLLGTWSTTSPFALSGPYTLKLSNREKAGNTAQVTISYVVDNYVPTASTSPANNDPFSPNNSPGVKDTTTVNLTASDNYSFDSSCTWKFEVKTTSGTHIWQTTGFGSPPANVIWNGRDDGGAFVPDATYNYYFTVTDRAGNSITTAAKQVTVDNTSPASSVGVAAPDPFSPGGAKPTTSFILNTSDSSNIDTWTLEIKNGSSQVVRSTSGTGNLTNWTYVWDGRNNPPTSAIVSDGTYTYTLTAIDNAGNSATSTSKSVIVDTTGPSITASAPTVDPFGGSAKPSTVVTLSYSDANGFDNTCNWNLTFTGVSATKTFSGTGTPPSSREWLGDKDPSGTAPDGTYTYSFSVTDKAGNNSTTAGKTVILDKTPPTISQGDASVNPFSPNSSPGIKDTTTITTSFSDTNGANSWSLTFKNVAQIAVRTYSGFGSPPPSQVWDGKYDDNVTYVPDGQYSYVLSVTDNAGNTASTAIKYVTVDNTLPNSTVGVSSPDPFSPGGAKPTTGFTLNGSDVPPGVVASWNLAIKDGSATVVRSTSELGSPQPSFVWDGRDNASVIVSDGTYSYALGVTDTAGNITTSAYRTVIVDRAAPSASVGAASPSPFSPNNDGYKDSTTVNLNSSDQYGFDSSCTWKLTFHSTSVTKTYSGNGAAPSSQTWDGTKDGGGTAPSDTYSYDLRVTDKAGNITTSASQNVILDIIPPTVSASAPNPAAFSNSVSNFTTIITSVSDANGFDGTCPWNMVFKNSAGATVRTITGSNAPTSAIVWDGKYDSGVNVPEDSYTYIFSMKDIAGNSASTAQQSVVVDNSPPLVSASDPVPACFSPNNDGYQDTTTLAFSSTDSSGIVSWQVRIYTTSFDSPVRTTSGSGTLTNWPFVWDGKNNLGATVSDEIYKYVIRATNGASLASTSTPEKTVKVDTVPPIAAITDPTNGSVKGGVVDVRGTANDANFVNYILEYKNVASSSWTQLVNNSTPVINDSLYAWNTKTGAKAVSDGDYNLKLTSNDGSTNSIATVSFTVDNTPPDVTLGSPSPQHISPSLSPGVQDSTSSVLSVTDAYSIADWYIEVRPVGTTSYVKRTTGSGNPSGSIVWNGKDQSGNDVAEGNYRFVVGVNDLAGNPGTAQSADIIVDHTPPFVSLGPPNPGAISPNGDGVKDTCAFALNASDANGIKNWKLEIHKGATVHFTATGPGSPPLNYTWDGKNNSGLVVPEDSYDYRLTVTDNAGITVQVNGLTPVLVDVTKPVIGTPAAAPDHFSPSTSPGLKDTTTISASVNDASPFDWTVKIYNSVGELSKQFSGTGTTITKVWNGLNESGNLLADGIYTFNVNAIDVAGNTALTQSATVIVDDTYPSSSVGDASNPFFSPNGDGVKDNTTMPFVATDAYGLASWQLGIKNSSDVVVRSTSGPGAPPASFVWDGRNDSGIIVSSGTYSYSLTVTDLADNSKTSDPKYVTLDSEGPNSVNPSASRDFFSPKGTRADSSVALANGYPVTTISASASDVLSSFHWTMTISSGGTVYRTFTGNSVGKVVSIAQLWDGKDESGKVVVDGTYTYCIQCTDDAGNIGNQISSTVTVDTTYAAIGITKPSQDEIIQGTFSVIGTATDSNFDSYKLWIGQGTSPQIWSIAPLTTTTSFSPVSGGTLSTWDTTVHLTDPTLPSADGIYVIKLKITDKANNVIEMYRLVSVDNKVVQSNFYPIPGIPDGAGNLYVSGIVNIVGSATATGLDNFYWYWLEAYYPVWKMWFPLAIGLTPVTNSTLGVWYTWTGDGKYTLRLQVKDVDNNIVLRTVKDVIVDNTPPSINSVYPTDRSSLTHTVSTLSADVSDNCLLNTSAFQLRINDRVVSASYTNGKIIYAPAGGLPDGSHNAELTLKDLAGNSTYKSWNFSIDAAPPVVQITWPESGDAVSGKVVVVGTVKDNYYLRQYSFEVKPSDSLNDTWEQSFFISEVNGGNLATWIPPAVGVSTAYDLRITATDISGNVTISPITTVWVSPSAPSVGSAGITSVGQVPVSNLSTSYLTGVLQVNGIAPSGYSVTSRQIYPVTGPYVTIGTLNNPIKNGTLATWNASSLNGKYELELHQTSTSPALQTVTVALDCRAPLLYPIVSPEDGSLVNNPTTSITAKVLDPEPYFWITGADTTSKVVTESVTMKLDGVIVSAGYDAVNKKVVYQPVAPLSNEKHKVDLRVADRAGNSVSSKWSFTMENGGSLTAIISHLAQSSSIGGIYPVRGTACGGNFSNYILDFYMKDDPLNRRNPTWMYMWWGVTPVKVTDGTLGTWYAMGWNGWVNLRLRAFDKAGNVKTYGPVSVQLDNKGPIVGTAWGTNATDFSPAPNSYVNSQSYDGTLKVYNVYDQLDSYYKPGSGIADTKIDMTINGTHVFPTYDSINSTITYIPSGLFAGPNGGFADGTYSVKLSVYDKVGNVTTKDWSFTVDNTPPSASIDRPVDNAKLKRLRMTAVLGVANDANISSYTISSKLSVDDDDLYKACYYSVPGTKVTRVGSNAGFLGYWFTPYTEGNYDIKVTATDLAGNSSVATSKNIYVSSLSDVPTASANLADPPTGWLRGTIPIKGTVCTESFGYYYLNVTQMTGGLYQVLLAGSFEIVNGDLYNWISPYTSGTFKIELKVYDKFGVEITSLLPGNKTVYVTVDNVRPMATTVFPESYSHVNPDTLGAPGGRWLSVGFSESTMDSTAFIIKMDGQSVPLDFTGSGNAHFNPSTSLLTVNPDPVGLMKDGKHTFTIDGKDIAGNSLLYTRSWFFNVDRNKPLPGALGVSPITSAASLDILSGSYVSGFVSIPGRVFDQNIYKYFIEAYKWNGAIWQKIQYFGADTVITGWFRNVLDDNLGYWWTGEAWTPALNGLYKLALTVIDKAGNALTDEKAVIIDNNAPTGSITYPTYLDVVHGVCTITGTANDDANFDKYVVDFGPGYYYPSSWTTLIESTTPITSAATLAAWDTNGLEDGVYTIRLTVTDKAKNQKVIRVLPKMVENNSPTITVSSPVTDGSAWVSGKASLIGTVSDKNLMIRKIVIDKVPSSGWPYTLYGWDSVTNGLLGTWDSVATKATDGSTYSFTVSASDLYGHFGNTLSFTCRIDNAKPVMSKETPTPGYTVSSPSEVSAEFDDALSGIDNGSIVLKVDGSAVTPDQVTQIGSKVTVQKFYAPGYFTAGSHVVNFRFKDKAGNWVSRSWLFKVQ